MSKQLGPLSPAQWRMLEKSATGTVYVTENMNTMGALYARSVVKFAGKMTQRHIVPTKLGSQYLHMKAMFMKATGYNGARDMIRSFR